MISWSSFGDNFIRIKLGTDEVEPEKYVVPKEDDEVGDSPTNFVEKSHDCSVSLNNFQLVFWTVRAVLKRLSNVKLHEQTEINSADLTFLRSVTTDPIVSMCSPNLKLTAMFAAKRSCRQTIGR